MNTRHRPTTLTSGPVGRTLIAFALPTLGSNVLQSSNASINAIWVGRFLGERALAATSNGNLVLFLLLGLVFGVSLAASVLVGQHIGAQRLDDAKRVVGTSTTFFVVASTIAAALGIAFTPLLLRWMNTPADVVPLAVSYMRVLFIGLPSMFFYQYVMMILRAAGDARTPFTFMLWSVGLDIALNPLFIFGWGPVPGIGIAGAALATFVAQTGTLAALLIRLYRQQFFLCIRTAELAYLRMDRRVMRLLVSRGVPMGLQMLVVSSSMLVMLTLVNQFGSETTAALGAVMQIWTYIQMPAFALGASVTAMAAQNIGAGHWDRVTRIANAGIAINMLLTGVPVLVAYLFNRQLVGLFLPPGAEAIAIAAHANLITLWAFVIFAIAFVYLSIPRAAGAVLVPLGIMFTCFWLLRVPFATLITKQWGRDGIWWSFPLGNVATAILAMIYYKHGNWRGTRLVQRTDPTPIVEVANAPEL